MSIGRDGHSTVMIEIIQGDKSDEHTKHLPTKRHTVGRSLLNQFLAVF